MPRSDFTKKISNAAHVDADDLARLTEQLAKVGPVEYSFECANGEVLKTSDISELIRYENAKGSHIVSLSMSSHGDNIFSSSASITFDPGAYGGVKLSLREDSELVGRLRTDIQKIVSGMNPWYWWIHRFSFGMSLLVLMFGYFVFTALQQAWFPSTRPLAKPQSNLNDDAYAVIIVMSAVFVVAAAGFLVDLALRAICPRVYFMIGQGIKRYKVLENIQWTVVIGGVVGIVTSLIV